MEHLAMENPNTVKKVKGKIFYGQEPPSAEYAPLNVVSIINYFQYCY